MHWCFLSTISTKVKLGIHKYRYARVEFETRYLIKSNFYSPRTIYGAYWTKYVIVIVKTKSKQCPCVHVCVCVCVNYSIKAYSSWNHVQNKGYTKLVWISNHYGMPVKLWFFFLHIIKEKETKNGFHVFNITSPKRGFPLKQPLK